jgi:quinol monooxygenase YgiN
MIIVRFKMLMNPKNKNELLNAVRNISEEVRKEEGCIDNIILQSLNDENELIMLESWKSRSLLKKHWKTINFSALLGIQNLLNKPIKVEINNVSGTQGLAEIEKIRAGKRTKNYEKGLKVYDNFDNIS